MGVVHSIANFGDALSRLSAVYFYNDETLYRRNRIEAKLAALGVKVKRSALLTHAVNVDLTGFDIVLYQEDMALEGPRGKLLDRAAAANVACLGLPHQVAGWDRLRNLIAVRRALCGAKDGDGPAVIYRRKLGSVDDVSREHPNDVRAAETQLADARGEAELAAETPPPSSASSVEQLASAAEESEKLAQLYADELEVERARTRDLESEMGKLGDRIKALEDEKAMLRKVTAHVADAEPTLGAWSRETASALLAAMHGAGADLKEVKVLRGLIATADAAGVIVDTARSAIEKAAGTYNRQFLDGLALCEEHGHVRRVRTNRQSPAEYTLFIGRAETPQSASPRSADVIAKLQRDLATERQAAALAETHWVERIDALQRELQRAPVAASSSPLNGGTKKARAILAAHREDILTHEETVAKLAALIEAHP